MLCRQAVALTVVMVSFVSTRLKRKNPELDTPQLDQVHFHCLEMSMSSIE
jgi:hypothetical protein